MPTPRPPTTSVRRTEWRGPPWFCRIDPSTFDHKLLHVQRMTGAEELIMNFRFGAMPVETAERSMRLFAAEVLPRLHAAEAPLHADMSGVPLAAS